ncbi:MAG: hypothetical protein ABI867_15635 [Kofleriaceae bacterium]
MANPAPTTATNPVLLTGTASDINVSSQMLEPVADATIKAFKAGVTAPAAMTTSDAGGAWSLSVASAGAPVNAFVEATKADHRTVRIYPPQDLDASLDNIPTLLLANTTFGLLVQFVAMTTQTAGNGTVGLTVLDCANTPISGATISVKQNDVELVTADNTFDTSGLGQGGAFLVFDLPPGETVVSATFNGMTFRAHTIDVVADTNSTTAVKPGFTN